MMLQSPAPMSCDVGRSVSRDTALTLSEIDGNTVLHHCIPAEMENLSQMLDIPNSNTTIFGV